eukprot:TRINITY_DN6694_c0_g1_i1.p1 TRINITY_DN6694_c0_g1~~TRINITY_DN6694_c0_g1_i1.p1  ORF type:complete len:2260 (-),score=477.08 TRINITY_DN6694_c0_g1_i1:543-7322(-)
MALAIRALGVHLAKGGVSGSFNSDRSLFAILGVDHTIHVFDTSKHPAVSKKTFSDIHQFGWCSGASTSFLVLLSGAGQLHFHNVSSDTTTEASLSAMFSQEVDVEQVQLLLPGCRQPLVIVVFNNQVIVANIDSPSLHRQFSLESAETSEPFLCYAAANRYLFALAARGVIHVWNVEGSYIGVVDTVAFAKRVDSASVLTSSSRMENLSVAADAQSVVVTDNYNVSLVVPLDLYFHLFPQHISTRAPVNMRRMTMIPESKEGKEGKEIDLGSEVSSTHESEGIEVQSGTITDEDDHVNDDGDGTGDDDDEDEEEEVPVDDRTMTFGCKSWRHLLQGRWLVEARLNHPWARLHWNQWAAQNEALRQAPSTVPPWAHSSARATELFVTAASASVLPVVFRAPEDCGELSFTTLSDNTLTLVSSEGVICQFDLASRTVCLHEFREAGVVPVTLPNNSVVVLRNGNLWLPLQHTTATEFLDHIIMMNGTETAQRISELNGWDPKELHLHALRLGLNLRQLDVVQSALGQLTVDQHSAAVGILMDHIQKNVDSMQDYTARERLLVIASSFIARTIASRCTSSQGDDAVQLTKSLLELRAIQNRLAGGVKKKPVTDTSALIAPNAVSTRVPVERLVRRSLLQGTVSATLGYLHELRSLGGVAAANPFTPYDEFHAASLRAVYSEICSGQVETAASMVHALGESVPEYFGQLAMRTVRRQVRSILATYLRDHQYLSFIDEPAHQLVTRLEAQALREHYPRSAKSRRDADPQLVCDTVDDDAVPPLSDAVPLSVDELEQECAGLGVVKYGAYFQLAAKWAVHWDEVTRHRALLAHLQAPVSDTFTQLIAELNFVALRVDTGRIVSVARRIASSSLDAEMMAAILVALSSYTSFVREIVLSTFASSGLLIPLEQHGLQMFRRLASVLSLFDSERPSSELHRSFMEFCVQYDLPRILQYYVKAHKLTVDDAPKDMSSSAAWLNTVLLHYQSPSILDASLASAGLCLPAQTSAITPATMFECNRPLMAIGTLLHTTMGLLNETGSRWYVDPVKLEAWAARHASVQRALSAVTHASDVESHLVRGDLQDSSRNVTLHGLLKNASFDLSAVFQESLLHCSFPPLKRYAYFEQMDATYYLVHARPLHGYLCLLRSGALEELLQTPSVLYHLVARVAFHNVLNPAIVASCISFLELCNLDPTALATDVELVKRLYALRSRASESSPQDVSEIMLQLAPYSTTHDQAAFDHILAELEHATNSLPAAALAVDAFAAARPLSLPSSPFVLAAVFCHSRRAPSYMPYLQDLANSNRWSEFLHAACVLHVPRETLLTAIADSTSSAVRQHLFVALRAPADSTETALSANPSFDSGEIALIDRIYTSLRNQESGRSLLVQAMKDNRPILVIAASAFEDVRPEDCALVWLHSSASVLLDALEDHGTFEPRQLVSAICELCDRMQHNYVLHALTMFLPSSPYLPLVRFHEAFAQSQYDVAIRYATAAFQISGIDQLFHETVLHLARGLLSQVGLYGARQLIHVLTAAGAGEPYAKLEKCAKALVTANIPFSFDTVPSAMVQQMIDGLFFNEARVVASVYGLNSDVITLNEVCNLARSHHPFLWAQCQALLAEQHCSPQLAASFYLWQASRRLQTIGVHELLRLFQLALDWLDGEHGPIRSATWLSELQRRALLLKLAVSAGVIAADADTRSELNAEKGELPPLLDMAVVPEVLSGPIQARGFTWNVNVRGADTLLDRVLTYLLSHHQRDKAQQLCTRFDYKSDDMALVAAAESIVMQQRLLPSGVMAILKAKHGVTDATDIPPAKLLDLLAASSRNARECILSMQSKFQVARVLGVTYDVVEQDRPQAILKQVLVKRRTLEPTRVHTPEEAADTQDKTQGELGTALARAFIIHSHLTVEAVADVLTEVCVEGICAADISACETTMPLAQFGVFVRLCSEPQLVGYRILEAVVDAKHPANTLITSADNRHAVETELLVRSHYCHMLAACADGVERVLRAVRERVGKYFAANNFNPLLRLLTGIKRYSDLEYIFHLLMEADQFELLVKKSNDKDGMVELRTALANYVRKNYPGDTEKLTMVFLRFNMVRELAELLFEDGRTRIQQGDLALGMQKLLGAADTFASNNSHKRALECLSLASVVGLQSRQPKARLLNLSRAEARAAIQQQVVFADALVLASHYDLNYLVEWIGPVYHQVCVCRNLTFLDDYYRMLPTPPQFFAELVARMRKEPDRARYMAPFRAILAIMDDVVQRRTYAAELGYPEL